MGRIWANLFSLMQRFRRRRPACPECGRPVRSIRFLGGGALQYCSCGMTRFTPPE